MLMPETGKKSKHIGSISIPLPEKFPTTEYFPSVSDPAWSYVNRHGNQIAIEAASGSSLVFGIEQTQEAVLSACISGLTASGGLTRCSGAMGVRGSCPRLLSNRGGALAASERVVVWQTDVARGLALHSEGHPWD